LVWSGLHLLAQRPFSCCIPSIHLLAHPPQCCFIPSYCCLSPSTSPC
jgi:hypothetical protein